MSRHKKICIVHEPKTTKEAKILANYLKKRNYEIIFLCKDRFPIADPMINFLFKLSLGFDTTFILISDSLESSIWLSREIRIQHFAGNCPNIYPVFLKSADIPDWWLGKNSYSINLDSASQDKLDTFMNSAEIRSQS